MDGLRRLTTTTLPDTTTETYTYKPDGLLATKKDRKNQTITYSYDSLKATNRGRGTLFSAQFRNPHSEIRNRATTHPVL